MENAARVNGSMVVTLISGQALDHYAKHVFEERKVVVANDKAGTIQQKERQKTAHTAVAIVKGVDADEPEVGNGRFYIIPWC